VKMRRRSEVSRHAPPARIHASRRCEWLRVSVL